MVQPFFPSEQTAYLGLGSNLGDTVATLAAARDALAHAPHSRLLACSSLYRTEPVGGPADQPDYCNAVVALATMLPPSELLEYCLALEARFGRLRKERWGARTLDVDLLLYDELVLSTPALVLPHPRLHQRRFVLQPLCDLAPEFPHPVLGATFGRLLAALSDPARVVRLNADW